MRQVSASGSLAANGAGDAIIAWEGPIRLRLSGNWTGTVVVERSDDGGITFHGITLGGDPWGVFTGNCDEVIDDENQRGAQWRINAQVDTGEIEYRISQ